MIIAHVDEALVIKEQIMIAARRNIALRFRATKSGDSDYKCL